MTSDGVTLYSPIGTVILKKPLRCRTIWKQFIHQIPNQKCDREHAGLNGKTRWICPTTFLKALLLAISMITISVVVEIEHLHSAAIILRQEVSLPSLVLHWATLYIYVKSIGLIVKNEDL